jgi:hypothetical protein
LFILKLFLIIKRIMQTTENYKFCRKSVVNLSALSIASRLESMVS